MGFYKTLFCFLSADIPSNPAYYLLWNVGRYTTATNINKLKVAGEESVENMEIFHALCARTAILPITIFAIYPVSPKSVNANKLLLYINKSLAIFLTMLCIDSY